MYVWSENIASRGAQEIGSCLLLYLQKIIQPSIKKIIMYSDSAGGNNRNIKMILFLKKFLQASELVSITQQDITYLGAQCSQEIEAKA